MIDERLVEAVVRAALRQLRVEEPPCSCHAAPAGCCPDRMDGLVGHGAARFGLRAEAAHPRELARRIDHTLLKPEATRDEILKLGQEPRQHGFAAVCVNPTWVPLCVKQLRGLETRVCTVVGFPLGVTLPEVKAHEASRTVAAGACELDMVLGDRDIQKTARSLFVDRRISRT